MKPSISRNIREGKFLPASRTRGRSKFKKLTRKALKEFIYIKGVDNVAHQKTA
jgi:hypothetical protein